MKELFENYIRQFKILTEKEIKLIVNRTEVKEFKKGNNIDVRANCYLVLQGCIREYILKDDTEKTTGFYLEGNSIVAPPSNNKSDKIFKCMENCILTISSQQIEKEVCALVPRLQSIILDEVQNNAHKVKEELAMFISSTTEERYNNLLKNKPSLFQRVPQHQIASYIGLTPESFSRLRKRIKAKS